MPHVIAQLTGAPDLPLGQVMSLRDIVPPARYDRNAYVRAHVLEAATPAGPWTDIDNLLIPVDADPSNPQPKNVTTAKRQLLTGWYRLVFYDAGGFASEPSEMVRNSIEADVPPSPEDVRDASPLLRQKFPIPPVDPMAPADLRDMTYQATAAVQAITWRLIDPTLGDLAPTGYLSEALPVGMESLALQAIVRMAERLKVTSDPTFAEQVATGRRLRGFTAGPYSESYFAPGEFARRGAQQSRPVVDADDALDAALWALMTEDARDYFIMRSTGQAIPYGEATAFDYRRETIGYGSSGAMIGAHGGPDGF